MPAVRRAALLAPVVLVGFLLLPEFVRPYSPGLDPGYAWGIAEAIRQGAVHGRDIVFPYGPLGFLLLGPPDPTLAPWSLVYAIAVHLATILGFAILLLRRGTVRASWGFAIAFLSIAVAFFTNPEHEPALAVAALVMPALAGGPIAPAVGVLAGALAALALLVKVSVGAPAAALVIAAGTILAGHGAGGRKAAGCLVAGTATVLVLAVPLLFGGLSSFLTWMRSTASLASGFASSMSVPGPAGVEAIGATTLLALVVAAIVARRCRLEGGALWAGLLPAAWLAYRHAFVRADGHVYHFAYLGLSWLLLAMLVLSTRGARRLGAVVLALALAVAAITTARVERPGGVEAGKLLSGQIGFDRLASYLRWRDHVEGAVRLSRDELAPLDLESPTIARWRDEGSTFDVLPWDLLQLPANGLDWRPNPVLQLYQASTPLLDRRVARHFASPDAPERILVHLDPIDGRHLLWEAPETWRAVLAGYLPGDDQPFAGRLVLERAEHRGQWSFRPLGELDLEPRTWYELPPVDPEERVLLALELTPSLSGRLRSAFLRIDPITVSLRPVGGRSRAFRLVPGVAGGGLLVDLPARTVEELVAIVRGAPTNGVRDVRIQGPGLRSLVTPVRARWLAARLIRPQDAGPPKAG